MTIRTAIPEGLSDGLVEAALVLIRDDFPDLELTVGKSWIEADGTPCDDRYVRAVVTAALANARLEHGRAAAHAKLFEHLLA